MSDTVDYQERNGVWQVFIYGKPRLDFASREAAIKAVAQIRGYRLPRKLLDDEDVDEWFEMLDDFDDEPLTHYCDNCDEECEPDGVWNGIFLFYCHSCAEQYKVAS